MAGIDVTSALEQDGSGIGLEVAGDQEQGRLSCPIRPKNAKSDLAGRLNRYCQSQPGRQTAGQSAQLQNMETSGRGKPCPIELVIACISPPFGISSAKLFDVITIS